MDLVCRRSAQKGQMVLRGNTRPNDINQCSGFIRKSRRSTAEVGWKPGRVVHPCRYRPDMAVAGSSAEIGKLPQFGWADGPRGF